MANMHPELGPSEAQVKRIKSNVDTRTLEIKRRRLRHARVGLVLVAVILTVNVATLILYWTDDTPSAWTLFVGVVGTLASLALIIGAIVEVINARRELRR